MNSRQLKFCEEYLRDFNATKAAIRAGYSPKTAYSIGNENLKKPEIKMAIENYKIEVSKKTELSIISLINDVALIKDKCIHESFDPGNALKACELLSKFLTQNEIKQKELIKGLSLEELENLARSLMRP